MKKTKVPGLANNIRTMRENSGITLEDAAKRLGLSAKSCFAAYESALAEPNLSTLIKMSEMFKYDLNDILIGVIERESAPIFHQCKTCGNDVKSVSGRPLNSNYCNNCYWNN